MVQSGAVGPGPKRATAGAPGLRGRADHVVAVRAARCDQDPPVRRHAGEQRAGDRVRWVQSVEIPDTMFALHVTKTRVSLLVIVLLGFAMGPLASTIDVGRFVGVLKMMCVLGAPGFVASAGRPTLDLRSCFGRKDRPGACYILHRAGELYRRRSCRVERARRPRSDRRAERGVGAYAQCPRR